MSIETSFKIQNSDVHIICTETFTFESMKELIVKAFDFAAEKNIMGILVDGTDVQGKPPTTIERYNLGEYISKLCFEYRRPFRIAIVVGKTPLVDPERFGETVAVNRGANGKVFTDLVVAKEWLT